MQKSARYGARRVCAALLGLVLFVAAAPALAAGHYPLVLETFRYPILATQARISGDAIVEIRLAADGSVAEIKRLSGHPLLLQAASDALRSWRFAPLEQTPGESPGTITVTAPAPHWEPSQSSSAAPHCNAQPDGRQARAK